MSDEGHDYMNEQLRAALGRGRFTTEEEPVADEAPTHPDGADFDAGARTPAPAPFDANRWFRRALGRARGWAGLYDPEYRGD